MRARACSMRSRVSAVSAPRTASITRAVRAAVPLRTSGCMASASMPKRSPSSASSMLTRRRSSALRRRSAASGGSTAHSAASPRRLASSTAAYPRAMGRPAWRSAARRSAVARSMAWRASSPSPECRRSSSRRSSPTPAAVHAANWSAGLSMMADASCCAARARSARYVANAGSTAARSCGPRRSSRSRGSRSSSVGVRSDPLATPSTMRALRAIDLRSATRCANASRSRKVSARSAVNRSSSARMRDSAVACRRESRASASASRCTSLVACASRTSGTITSSRSLSKSAR